MSEFIYSSGLTDLRNCGSFFTWWDKNKTSPKYSKIDRVMVNVVSVTSYANLLANFMPRGVSDHNPAAVSVGFSFARVKKPYQMFNHLIDHPHFLNLVKEAWDFDITGDRWWILTGKLKRVKQSMISRNRNGRNLHLKVIEARSYINMFQEGLPPPSLEQLEEEARLIEDYNCALKMKRFFFVKTLVLDGLRREMEITVVEAGGTIEDDNGEGHENLKEISNIAVDFFKNLMGSSFRMNDIPEDLVLPVLSDPSCKEEVWNVLKKIACKKCPGPEGFSVEFFVAAWSIMKEDVLKAILYFSTSLHMPRSVNAAVIALVPKQKNLTRMAHFRPISCCNVITKCISKLLTLRMKKVLPSLVSLTKLGLSLSVQLVITLWWLKLYVKITI
ncbi:hypothetical protein AgCh_004445 [Apium graveolens]